jgi:hypothetical protein
MVMATVGAKAGTMQASEGLCVGVPNGIRFVSGNDPMTGAKVNGDVWFNCQQQSSAGLSGPNVPGVVPGHYARLNDALANCPAGALVGAILEFPNCWDGKRVQAADRRSNVADQAYINGQLQCDPAHPYVFPKLSLGQWWFSPGPGMVFTCNPSDLTGSCIHGDYFENWDPTVKAMWFDNCIRKRLNCSGGDLGNGQQLKGGQ